MTKLFCVLFVSLWTVGASRAMAPGMDRPGLNASVSKSAGINTSFFGNLLLRVAMEKLLSAELTEKAQCFRKMVVFHG